MSTVIAALLGGLGWTLAEYLIHRFDGHGMKGRTKFSREHLAHHADPQYFAPLWMKVAIAAVVVVPMAALGHSVVGIAGIAFTVGFVATYVAYEVLHRRIHTHAPLNGYGAWARRHHLHHHHNAPAMNHGVTSPLWDMIFRTLAPVEAVRVPRRHAPIWMVKPTGDLLPEYVDSYVLRGRLAKAVKPAA